ncbi:MAG: ABC transporter permease [Lentisphaerae bacterium]|nr:ABC transporter permease [Lentisphaerota bacterium]
MTGLIRDVARRRELLLILVGRNLKIRYKNSVLGFFWTLLSPLFLIAVYAVFARVLRFYRAGDTLFMPRLVTGIIVWQFVAMCLNDSLRAVLGNADLVKKSAFPRIVLPLATLTANLVNFALSGVVLVAYLQIARMPVQGLAWLPLVLATHVALCLGAGLIVACANVFFRDTEHIVGIALLAWFFLTPIIYTFDYVPAGFRDLAFINPLTGIVTAYRWMLMSDVAADARLIAASFIMAWTVLAAGAAVFQKLQMRFAEEL